MTYHPKNDNRKAIAVTAVCFVLSIILYTLGQLGLGLRMPLQLCALILLSCGIMLASRYLLSEYKYTISDISYKNGTMDLSIIRISGKREVEMAHFDIASIYAIGRERSLSEFEKAHGRVNKVFNYISNYGTKNSLRFAISFNGQKVMFVIEADADFEKELRARANTL